jgi:hypothetical protein
MALTKKAKQTNQKKELIVTAEMLAEIRLLVKRIGGIENFNYAMDVWEHKGPKKRVEDVISPEQLAKMYYHDEDGNLFLKNNSGNKKAGDKVGFLKRQGYIVASIKFEGYYFTVFLNKIIFCLHNGRWAKKGYKVDHINEDKTDNRPCNLRESTNSQNASNKSLYESNKSGVKGVFVRSISDDRVRVDACVSCNGKKYFKSMTVKKEFVEATIQILKAWRDEIGRKLHGEFFNEG